MGAELSGEALETGEDGRGVAREDRAGVQRRGVVAPVCRQFWLVVERPPVSVAACERGESPILHLYFTTLILYLHEAIKQEQKFSTKRIRREQYSTLIIIYTLVTLPDIDLFEYSESNRVTSSQP